MVFGNDKKQKGLNHKNSCADIPSHVEHRFLIAKTYFYRFLAPLTAVEEMTGPDQKYVLIVMHTTQIKDSILYTYDGAELNFLLY